MISNKPCLISNDPIHKEDHYIKDGKIYKAKETIADDDYKKILGFSEEIHWISEDRSYVNIDSERRENRTKYRQIEKSELYNIINRKKGKCFIEMRFDTDQYNYSTSFVPRKLLSKLIIHKEPIKSDIIFR